jgi:hypothetical protein
MEIKVNIPKNDYVQPKEVRQWVVQGICEAFLSHCCWSIFHPHNDGFYRQATTSIVRHRNSKEFYGFHHGALLDSDESVRFNGEEMKTAFIALIDAGYHIFKVYQYGSWLGFKCSKKPHIDNGCEVFSFNDFID